MEVTCGDSQNVVLPRKDLDLLLKEARTMKESIGKIINPDLIQTIEQVSTTKQTCSVLSENCHLLSEERDHWKARCEAAQSDIEALKQEKLELRCNLQEVRNQMSQQTEYCASMGAACGTLLWRVSSCNESIQPILAGSKVPEFLSMVSNTLSSYLATYSGDEIPQEEADETQFVLGLCGIVANIASSPVGRDYLMREEVGRSLFDTFLTVLAEAPNKTCEKMKGLILMAIYNVTMNQKGMKYIINKPNIIGLLVWIAEDTGSSELKLMCLRVLQSLFCDDINLDPALLSQVEEALTSQFIHALSEDSCAAIREVALELVNALQNMFSR